MNNNVGYGKGYGRTLEDPIYYRKTPPSGGGWVILLIIILVAIGLAVVL